MHRWDLENDLLWDHYRMNSITYSSYYYIYFLIIFIYIVFISLLLLLPKALPSCLPPFQIYDIFFHHY